MQTKVIVGDTGSGDVKETTTRNTRWDEIAAEYGEQVMITSWYVLTKTLEDLVIGDEVLGLGASITGIEVVDASSVGDGGADPEEVDEQERKRVLITYENEFGGEGCIAARLLVGADGACSEVRSSILGDGKPSFTGSIIWRAVLSQQLTAQE